MNAKKFAAMGLTVLMASFLWTAAGWAMEEDTGDPWFADIAEDNSSAVKHNNVYRVAPIEPSEQDSGYPWFSDLREYDQAHSKPVTTFGVHPRTAEHDTGYPWSNDSGLHPQTAPESQSSTQ